MSDSEVKVVKDSGKRLQWGHGWFYLKEGEKFRLNSKALKVLCGVIFVVMTFTTFMTSTDVSNHKLDTVEPGEYRSDSEKIKILDYMKTSEAREKAQVQANEAARRRSYGKRIAASKPTKLTPVFRTEGLEIPPGSETSAVLVTGATDGSIKARLLKDLEVAGDVYLPEGTLLLGLGASGDERLAIAFHTAVFENGKSQKVGAVAYDLTSRLVGLSGPKMGRRALKMAASTGLNFVAGVSQGFQDVDVQNGIAVQRPNLKNALLRGAGVAAFEQSKEMMESLRDKQSQIYVKAGNKILVVFQGGKH